ncbi:MAG: hypothetical protein LBD52_05580 [Prevotellaceae bacterium]|jgi:hypothetical protein|nr:hypothetical protein [Prevotellaceae bacterium]
MASKIESGIATYIGHFRLLIDVCVGFGVKYNPQIPALQIANLEEQLTGVQASVQLVDSLLPDYLSAEGARHEQFVKVYPLATRIQATAIVLGLPPTIVTRIKEIVHKIRGERAVSLQPEKDINPDGTPAKHISVSQTSFNEQIEHFNQLIDLVASQAAYTPAEADLTVPSLTALLGELRLTNDAVMAALPPLTAARQARNERLYAPQTGMIDTALMVKEYVKAAFGSTSPQYKEVRHIKFKNRKI